MVQILVKLITKLPGDSPRALLSGMTGTLLATALPRETGSGLCDGDTYMTLSFTPTEAGALAKSAGPRRQALVTGAAGRIGAYFAEHSHDRYKLRLMVHKLDDEARRLEPFGEVVTGDLGDLERMKELCRDIDTVVHLAADPDPSALWQSLL